MEACCENRENRLVLEKAKDRVVEQCSVCGRKHYEVTVDPIDFNVLMEGKAA